MLKNERIETLLNELADIVSYFVMQNLELSEENKKRGKEIIKELKAMDCELVAFDIGWKTDDPLTPDLENLRLLTNRKM